MPTTTSGRRLSRAATRSRGSVPGSSRCPKTVFTAANVDYWQLVDGSDTSWYTTYAPFAPPSPLPVGVVAMTNWRWAALWQTGSRPNGAASRCDENGPSTPPAGAEEFRWVRNDCVEETWYTPNPTRTPLVAHGWQIPTDVVFNPSLDPPDGADRPNDWTIPVEKLTKEELEQRLRDLLASNDPDYVKLRNWLCALLGGQCQNPKDYYPTAPNCEGLAPVVCTIKFRDAGFTGPVTVKTLTADEAIMEQPAGAVVDTTPMPGTADVVNRDITIYANPEVMPEMSAEEAELAEQLETQNAAWTTNNTGWDTIARTCRRLTVEKAGKPGGDCASLPIFVVGREARSAAFNDIAAIERYPPWVILNARNAGENPKWYRNRATPEPGCLEADRYPANAQCDEYPYWSAMQGWQGPISFNPLGLDPSIMWTLQKENRAEGLALAHFYSNNNGPERGWHGCDITKQDPADITPIPQSAFIVLPIPTVPTTGLCNKSIQP